MSTTTKTATTSSARVNLKDINKGDVFSESSHYRFVGIDPKGYEFTHVESGNPVFLTPTYVQNLLATADQFEVTEIVGREDKLWTLKQLEEATKNGQFANTKELPRVGDVRVKGIRTIFEEIHSAEVFGLCFQKQESKYTKKDLDALRSEQVAKATAMIEKAQGSKKSMKTAYTEALTLIQENPISEMKPGEMRELRGYKVQFTSRDGRYSCVDMDLPASDNIRPVNINTLQWLVYRGVKYVVEK